MQLVRKEDLSLHQYVKNIVLQDYVETETTTLTYLEDQSSIGSYVYQTESTMSPTPTSLGRGWRYVDSPADIAEQQNSIIVYDQDGIVIDVDSYMIDYVDGRIIMPNSIITPTSVTYSWNYIAIVDEWSVVESSELPVVVIDISGFSKEGFQLGAGKKVPRQINMHIFATDTAERDDIMETIYDGLYLMSCANQDFSSGTMLDWNGTFNQDYEYATISGSSNLKFDDVEARSIFVPLMSIPNRDVTLLSDLNRYRGRVRCTMFHWSEGW